MPLSVVSNLKEQARQALLPTDKAMVDLEPDDDTAQQVLSLVQAHSRGVDASGTEGHMEQRFVE